MKLHSKHQIVRVFRLWAALGLGLILLANPVPRAWAEDGSAVDPVVLEQAERGFARFVDIWDGPTQQAAEAAKAKADANKAAEQQAREEAEKAKAAAEADARADEQAAAESEAQDSDAEAQAAAEPAAEPSAPAAEAEPAAEAQSDPAADAWHVSYCYCQGASEAPADGSVGLWAPGYFIAHNWSANGARIASCVPYVVVDGQLYQFAGSTTYTRDTYYEDGPEAFAHAGGGIGFQTCYGDVYLVTHYVPC